MVYSIYMDAYESGDGCPGSNGIECTALNKTTLDIGVIPAVFSLASSICACVMSTLILIAYAAFEEMRQSKAQKLITLLAFADILSATSYIIAAINYLEHYNANSACEDFKNICVVQSFLNIWSSVATYVFTSILAFHFLLTVSQGSNFGQKMKKLFGWITAGPVYICAGWMLPFVLATIFLMVNKLGYYVASTWCYIDFDYRKGVIDADLVVTILFGGWLWELLALFITSVSCLSTLVTSRRLRRLPQLENEQQVNHNAQMQLQKCERKPPTSKIDSTTHSPSLVPEFPSEFQDVNPAEVVPSDAEREARFSEAVAEAEMRIKFVPLVFILLRIWDTVQIIASFIVAVSGQVDENGCTSMGIASMFVVIGVFEATGDGGQGWGNAILYILSSRRMRRKMFIDPTKRVKEKLMEWYKERRDGEEQRPDVYQDNDSEAFPIVQKNLPTGIANYGGTSP